MEELRDAKGLTLSEFLEIYKTKNYKRPYLTADILIFSKDINQNIYVLLVKRKGHPFIGQWALPGGFANEGETLKQSAERELAEETNLENIDVKLVGEYSTVNRDPRGWVVSVAYTGFVNLENCKPLAGDDAAETKWFKVEKSNNSIMLSSSNDSFKFDLTGEYLSNQKLAFDHQNIIKDGLNVWNI